MNHLMFVLTIGIGATALMDLWGIARQPLFGIPAPNYSLVGRWIAHMRRGKFRHQAIAAAPAARGEQFIGWTAHYIIGITFAALLVGLYGQAWIQRPTLVPALVVGLGTVVAPFMVMQPCMGAGIAAAKTPKPNTARLHSLITHAVFGMGLYLSAWALQVISPSLTG